MKCAECGTMHHGIKDLMAYRVKSLIRGMRCYDMLCKDCTKERSEAEKAYKAASAGS